MITVDRLFSMSIPEPNSGCWIWLRAVCPRGYGRGYFGPGESALAHRAMFKAKHGSIPRGMNVLHRCDNPSCINPDHLFPGTQLDNMQDCSRKGRVKPPRLKGDKHGEAKLSEEEARAILSSRDTTKSLMARFGVSRTAIQSIRARRTWKHL